MAALRAAALALALAFAGAAAVHAGDDTAAGADAVRIAWARLKDEQKATVKLIAAKLKSDDTSGVEAAKAALLKALSSFSDRFMTSDWRVFAATDASADDAALLKYGLRFAADDLLEREPTAQGCARAAQAYEMFVARYPDDEAAPRVKRSAAVAWFRAGDSATGLARLEKNVAEADSASKSSENLALGDWRCATGDWDGARRAWEAAATPEALRRAALVGTRAPEIRGSSWSGSAAKTLAELKGRVVVINFWETMQGPERLLNELAGREDGVVVLGATRYDADAPSGLLVHREGAGGPRMEVVTLTLDTIADYVRRARAAYRISYPLFEAAPGIFIMYRAPGTVVIDQAGTIALATSGSDRHDMALLRLTTQRLSKARK
jgi:hypothetical protein